MYKPKVIPWYSIGIDIGEGDAPPQFEYLGYNNSVMIGAHTRLAGNGARLNSEELAIEYIEALKVLYKKRYNSDFDFTLNKNESLEDFMSKQEIQKLESDSNIIRARLLTKNFAPNKKVDLSVLTI